jgi:uncharacterized protein
MTLEPANVRCHGDNGPEKAITQDRQGLHSLPQCCLICDVRFACNTGCPQDRFISTPTGEVGLHYLCAGYKAFFRHINAPMMFMADLLRQGKDADGLKDWYARYDVKN